MGFCGLRQLKSLLLWVVVSGAGSCVEACDFQWWGQHLEFLHSVVGDILFSVVNLSLAFSLW